MDYLKANYVGKKIQLYPGDTYSKFEGLNKVHRLFNSFFKVVFFDYDDFEVKSYNLYSYKDNKLQYIIIFISSN